ncbi:uncharacterized protein CC84DRAFT_1178074 [Paraphaeosphaeria sporulosa]|uniref:Uncharacterized protein n=1 Tax=Paraphaeosphaeria sporulosa TaxID=1460663 RepID=A0A177CBX3_9PLEO|nr:uncharacterized protein CC84DRAFT_1178074 [Paraphaeosphaeria sporulosa]OAG04200.1 hypothetical protein CC84DRAFT_1178074 [Paraphaeosphaeria sporulosa]
MAAGGRARARSGSEECTTLDTCTRRSRLAGESVDSVPSHFAGVKQAEAVDQSLAKGAAGATAESRALKQQGVSATESLARMHRLTGFAGDNPATSASAPGAGCPARGHGKATGRQHIDTRRQSSNSVALKSHPRSAVPPDNSRRQMSPARREAVTNKGPPPSPRSAVALPASPSGIFELALCDCSTTASPRGRALIDIGQTHTAVDRVRSGASRASPRREGACSL